MASILPEDILNNLLCSVCKKYLSYGPTKIHRNGGITCGRCNTNETTGPNSFYEELAKFSLFPCVNRYEGCNKLLHYKDVAQHEKTCKGAQFSCPICISDEISLLYLIEHYKTVHADYFLKAPQFSIDPSTMSENVYLYCDHYNNCLFLIKVGCTQDRLFLKACVPKENKVVPQIVQRFRLNNVLQKPNTVSLCSALEEPALEQLEVKIAEITGEKLISCEFLYDVVEKTATVVAIDLSSVEEPMKREWNPRKFPKIYLDSKIFPEKQKYKLSSCRSKLINEEDSNFNIKLKCDSCDTYFWNVPEWRKIPIEEDVFGYRQYGLYCCKYSDDLICSLCFLSLYNDQCKKILKSTITEPIFKMSFYCRYNCGMICSVWDLRTHEENCDFNLEKNSNEFVKKCFGENTYNGEDKFVLGNVVYPFNFDVAFYSSAIFGANPKIPDPHDVTSPEGIIYLVTDDGLKCRVYYKYERGKFCVRVEHDYGDDGYLVTIHVAPTNNNEKKIMYVKKSDFLSLSDCRLFKTEKFNPDGVAQYVHNSPCFVVYVKKILASCNLIL